MIDEEELLVTELKPILKKISFNVSKIASFLKRLSSELRDGVPLQINLTDMQDRLGKRKAFLNYTIISSLDRVSKKRFLEKDQERFVVIIKEIMSASEKDFSSLIHSAARQELFVVEDLTTNLEDLRVTYRISAKYIERYLLEYPELKGNVQLMNNLKDFLPEFEETVKEMENAIRSINKSKTRIIDQLKVAQSAYGELIVLKRRFSKKDLAFQKI